MTRPMYYGAECSGATLAPNSAPTVQAEIDQLLIQVRHICGKNSFVAVLRKDGGWVFIPTVGTKGNQNLCTLWASTSTLHFDVRSQSDRVVGRRRFPDSGGLNLIERLTNRYSRMVDLWRRRNL